MKKQPKTIPEFRSESGTLRQADCWIITMITKYGSFLWMLFKVKSRQRSINKIQITIKQHDHNKMEVLLIRYYWSSWVSFYTNGRVILFPNKAITLYIQVSLIRMYFYSHLLVTVFSNALLLPPGLYPECFGTYILYIMQIVITVGNQWLLMCDTAYQ